MEYNNKDKNKLFQKLKKHDNEAYKEEKLIPKTYFPNIRI